MSLIFKLYRLPASNLARLRALFALSCSVCPHMFLFLANFGSSATSMVEAGAFQFYLCIFPGRKLFLEVC